MTEQFEWPQERIVFVLALILDGLSRRGGLYPDLIMNLKGRRFFFAGKGHQTGGI